MSSLSTSETLGDADAAGNAPGASGEADGESSEANEADADTQSGMLSPDVIFGVLKNERRRRVVAYLRTHEGTVELGDIAEHIAALENDKEESMITYAERKRVYVGLYQCHLPKMDDMGVVDFNRARGLIETTAQTHQLVPYIEGPETHRPWHQYYAAAVLTGAVVYAATLTNLLPAVLTPLVAIGVLLAAVTTCTLFHYAVEGPHAATGSPI